MSKVENKEVQEIELRDNKLIQGGMAIVMPVISPEEAKKSWDAYENMKAVIKTPSDFMVIEGKAFLKKSYWRKMATFFNLDVEIVEEDNEVIGKTFAYHFTVKATAPNGRSAIGTGSCDAYEGAVLKEGTYYKYNKINGWQLAAARTIHVIRTTAETRATNRAISNLIGGGEVSAEEMI